MRVFIIGAFGGTGRRLGRRLVSQGDEAAGLVRHESQIEELARDGVKATCGDLVAMPVEELAGALGSCDAVVFAAGAGGHDGPDATRRVDGEGPSKMARAAKMAGVRRVVLVSVFPEAGRGGEVSADFEEYVSEKKKAEVALASTDLDWVILRPAVLTDEAGTGTVRLSMAEIRGRIPRDDVAETIVALLASPRIRREVLELTGGDTPIGEAVRALER